MISHLKEDLRAVFDRDPAVRSVFEIVLCYPGFHAMLFYRLSHWRGAGTLPGHGAWYCLGDYADRHPGRGSNVGLLCSSEAFRGGEEMASGFVARAGGLCRVDLL